MRDIFSLHFSSLFIVCVDFLGGGHDDVLATATILVLERLEAGDQIYVRTSMEGGDEESTVHSNVNKSIYFTGQRVSD